jgi:predicted acyltransferase
VNKRFYSLDIFRGATVALMILVNNPGSWSHIYGPLEHAPWHGCTPTDLVFPFFLFAVGNALSFVMPRLEAAGTDAFLRKVITRTLLIFLVGLFLNWSPFVRWDDGHLAFKHWVDPENPNSGIRILGVLQRIALCYFFASMIIYFFKIRGALLASFIFLMFYWMITLLCGTPGDPFSLAGYFGTGVDKNVLGVAHMYKGEGVAFDPEGITSTVPAIVQVIFGYFVGFYIQQKGKNYEMLTNLFIAGSILIFTGFIWDLAFPINKKIWTSSYVLYTTGLATTVLSILIYLVEMKKLHEQPGLKFGNKIFWRIIALLWIISLIFIDIPHDQKQSIFLAVLVAVIFFQVIIYNKLFRFFDVFGKNPLFIFFLSGFLPRIVGLLRWVDHVDEKGKNVYTTAFSKFYHDLCAPLSGDPRAGSLLYALCTILFYWVIVYFMDKRKIYIKV